jgi:two-component system, NtrC family, response regulator HydG
VVLTDMRMPDISGLELTSLIKEWSPSTQIIVMTGYADITTAIKAIKQGAFHYIPKPLNPDEVLNAIKEALNVVKKGNTDIKSPDKNVPFSFLEGFSNQSQQLKEYIGQVAPTPMSVLITGESGTGKEYVARLIHHKSKRNNAPFVAVDCGAISKELAASEFFGHLKGSFTGAVEDKTGHFEEANKGTLFLDEVGNLSYDTQVQLLRALQEGIIKPVGSTKEIRVDIRIIAATNENLNEAMEQGRFRKDLYHRLNEFHMAIPPLCERTSDIMLFADYFLDQANQYLNKSVTGFEKNIEPVFLNYQWPGNLRELKNVVKRATLLAKGEYITMNEIPAELYENMSLNEQKFTAEKKDESEAIKKALEVANYNKSKAARILNIDRKTLYNKLKSYNIDIPGKN